MAYQPTPLPTRPGQGANNYANWLRLSGPASQANSSNNFTAWFNEAATRRNSVPHMQEELMLLDGIKNMVRRANVQRGQRVLEIGCGTALLTQLILGQNGSNPSDYILVDRDPVGLSIAR